MATTTSDQDGGCKKRTEDAIVEDENSEDGTGNVDNSEVDREEDIPKPGKETLATSAHKRKVETKGKKAEVLPSTAKSEKNVTKGNTGQQREKEPSTTGKETTEDGRDDTTQEPGFLNIFNSVGILLVLALACILAAAFISAPEPEMKSDFDLFTIFGNGVDKLQQSFTNQTERFWKILKNRGLAHLRNKHPSQPLVFLLAAPPPAHEWVDCLATKLAEKLDPKQKRNLPKIDGNNEKSNPADKTKKKMDELLTNKFRAGHRVAIIHHLELLPPPSPILFYSYCDDQNAPHKHVAIIFTVHLPVEPSSSLPPKEAEGTVEKYLTNEVWSRDDKDAVAALLSRIADTVVLMNGESGYSLKAFCS